MKVEMESVSHTETKALESIEKKIDELPPAHAQPSIYRVHKNLRDLNKVAYEPDIVAIGPYHRGKEHLKMMEEHKCRYLKSLLMRHPGLKIENYILAVAKREQEARSCYADLICLNRDEFIEMLVLDGCFIVELILRWFLEDSFSNDPIFQSWRIMSSLKRDLVLFENQIPFFILSELFELMNKLIVLSCWWVDPFEIVLFFFESLHPQSKLEKSPAVKQRWRKSESQDVKHILDLLQIYWSHDNGNVIIDLESNTANYSESKASLIPSASELRDCNVEFKITKEWHSKTLFGVEFAGGTMSMAPLRIEEWTESFLRNIIAYEQHFPEGRLTSFTNHMYLLDCLINSPADADILCQSKIFENWLGDNEAIVNIFNRLCDSVVLRGSFPYAKIFKNINTHRQKKRNRNIATLKRKIFYSPWAYVSFFGALGLLILTIVQTVLAAIQLA